GRPGSAFPTRSVGTRTSMLVMACRLGFNRAADNIDSSGELMMNRGRFLVLLGIVCFAIGLGHWIQDGRAQQASAVQWIWFDEGDPTQSAPAETRYFRRVFVIDRPVQKVVDEGTLDITADNSFTVWINGHQVGKGAKWERIYRFDVTKLLQHGENAIAVEAK